MRTLAKSGICHKLPRQRPAPKSTCDADSRHMHDRWKWCIGKPELFVGSFTIFAPKSALVLANGRAGYLQRTLSDMPHTVQCRQTESAEKEACASYCIGMPNRGPLHSAVRISTTENSI
jgi:hypothetical protein